MNRRGFLSLLVGAAGAPLVPWRGLSHPSIFLLAQSTGVDWQGYCLCTSPFCNRLHRGSTLTQESLEDMLRQIRESVACSGKRIAITPTRVIVSPEEYKRRLAGVEIVEDPLLRPGHWYMRTPKLA